MVAETMGRLLPDDDLRCDNSPWAGQRFEFGFLLMWLFVGLVSAYDAWLVVKYWDTILLLERNPVCAYLIRLGNGHSDIFLRAKTSGTLAVLSILAGLYRNNRRMAYAVTAALSGFQLGLLAYLTFL